MRDWSLNSGERSVETIRADHRFRYEWAYDRIPMGQGLDLFCGTGYGTRMLSKEGHYVIGIDGSAEAIAFARTHHKGLDFIQAEWPLSLNPDYDFIVSLESIEHVEDGFDMLRKMSTALRPEGSLIFSTPNEDIMSHEWMHNPFHFRHFHHDEILKFMEDINMELKGWAGQHVYLWDKSVIPNQYQVCKDLVPGQFHIYHYTKRA